LIFFVIIPHQTMTYNSSRRMAKRLESARGYLMLEMAEQALEELDEVDDPDAVAYEWNLLRGEAYRALQQYRPAIKAYQRAQAVQPDEVDVLMGLAWCYKRTDQLPKSIDVMHQAYLNHRDEPLILYNLACYYALAGNKDQALSWLGRALRMKPDLRELIPMETDFDPIRAEADFRRLIELTERGTVAG
jgi:tetratricopeptide (TPR) repeat protein